MVYSQTCLKQSLMADIKSDKNRWLLYKVELIYKLMAILEANLLAV